MPRTPAPSPRPGVGTGLILALGYASMAGSITTDLYLPALPDIGEDFGAPASVVQLTLTAMLIGAAFGQLIVGAVSDALGRRRTLIAGFALYVVCCCLAVFSPSLEALIAVRALQGFSAASGAVLGRAIVSDLARPDQAVKAFSALFAMIGLGPALAAPLGAILTQWGGWRFALAGLAVLATGMLVVAILVIPESLPPERRHPFTPAALAASIARLMSSQTFVFSALAFAFGYCTLMVYLSSSSFIVQTVFGLSPLGYSLTFSMSAVLVGFGSWLNGRIGHRTGAERTLFVAQVLVIVSTGCGLALTATGNLTFAAYLAVICGFALGSGAIIASASSLAAGAAVGAAGAGSALVGFMQYAFGAAASPIGGAAGPDTPLPAMIGMTGFAVLGTIAAWVARRPPRRER